MRDKERWWMGRGAWKDGRDYRLLSILPTEKWKNILKWAPNK
jgi:hypothetical protein